MIILDLILKHKWFDMTESGEKPEEYREITSYWCRRICVYGGFQSNRNKPNICFQDCNCQLHSCIKHVPCKYTHVRLHRAYTKTTILKEIDFVSIGIGNSKWGAPNYPTFIIHYKNLI